MSKAKRKPRPSMPHWYWLGQDGCWFCDNRHNCNSCKANRQAGKDDPKLVKREDKQNREREKYGRENYGNGNDLY